MVEALIEPNLHRQTLGQTRHGIRRENRKERLRRTGESPPPTSLPTPQRNTIHCRRAGHIVASSAPPPDPTNQHLIGKSLAYPKPKLHSVRSHNPRSVSAAGGSKQRAGRFSALYSDHGASGASHLRAGYPALLQDARSRQSTSSSRKAWIVCRAIRNTWRRSPGLRPGAPRTAGGRRRVPRKASRTAETVWSNPSCAEEPQSSRSSAMQVRRPARTQPPRRHPRRPTRETRIGQHNLGWMYDNGQGVPQDNQQAVAWFRKAADQGATPTRRTTSA